MLSKHRMNENSHKKKKEKEDNKKAIAGGRLNDKAANETEIKKDKESLREEVIRELWDDNEERFIYNPIKKTINFTKARPTDYVLNKHIHLPKPLEIEEEINCEIRKKKFMKAFKEYTDRKKETGETRARTKRKKERHLKEGLSNLTASERKGLKSLKSRIESGEISIAQTDKSSRLAIMTRKQFLEAGLVHTRKGKEISWKEVRYFQNQTNENVWWFSEIMGFSEKKDKNRMKENLIDHGLEVPQMKILVKDHKEWQPDSGKEIPTRPVVDGGGGYNTHLSELLSQILEPIALEMTGAEIDSTEEALAAFDRSNKRIQHSPDWRKDNILTDLLKDDIRCHPDNHDRNTRYEIDMNTDVSGEDKSYEDVPTSQLGTVNLPGSTSYENVTSAKLNPTSPSIVDDPIPD